MVAAAIVIAAWVLAGFRARRAGATEQALHR